LVEPGAGGIPVDVETVCEARVGTMAEQIHPPGIVPVTDAHVIGDEIEDEPKLVALAGAGEEPERGEAAEFGIDSIVIADVVAV
jgi:hypothetical protein